MSQITIEHNPSEERLQELGVADWPIWEKEISKFPIDFDDTRMGPAIQDLWMLLSGDRTEMTRQLDYLLTGYQTFYDFNMRELHLLESLRTLRLINYSAWIAKRWDDPAFPMAFPWFNTPRYWQDRIIELREQIALMDEEPLAGIPHPCHLEFAYK